jgi:hypothetical protein
VGDGYARYQHVETDPAARRRGLAGTLVWHAGRYGREVLGASTLVIVADPADGGHPDSTAPAASPTAEPAQPSSDPAVPARISLSSVTTAETRSAGVMSKA